LIFKAPQCRLAPAVEKDRYGLHENNIEDQRYVNFLWPVIEEIKKRLSPPARGLDYGSGPNPVLVELLKREGFETLAYDPFFSPMDLSQVENLDFIVSTEAAEHFYNPGKEFDQIFKMLKPTAPFILKTELFQEHMDLQKWHYPRDPTHVTFFSESSLKWIARKFGRSLRVEGPSLCVFEGT
jgi:hypothetical protein